MPASTASLESLSSPSPSPPPPEEQRSQHSNNSNHSGAAGLDSGSELSELTEDEQDNDSRTNDDDTSRSSKRRKGPRSDRIVPAPMWDWAYKQKKSEKKDKANWRTDLVEEEEEEEEQAGPAKAMEEEEDDDQDKESNPDEDGASPGKSRALSDNEAGDNDDDDPPEDDGEYFDDTAPHRIRKDNSGDISGEDEDYADEAGLDAPDANGDRTPKVAASPDLSDDENDNVEEEEAYEDDLPDAAEAPKDVSDAEDYEDDPDAAADDPDALEGDEPLTTEAVTPAEGAVDPAEPDLDITMEVDAPPAIVMSPVAVAVSSIMAGSSLIQAASPSSSQPSTPSASRVSSRYPSAEAEPEQDPASEREAEPEPERKPSGSRAPRSRKGKARTRARRSRVAAAADAGEADLDGDQADGPDGENADGEDMDVATPELDLDSDMQPAHRAEALDVLATIELKFALLRERLYVEKMDTLAWEEGLIADGNHPELLHLHAELSKRRDKRLELASHRRDFEAANVTKRRRLDEEGVWSWWKDARNELQTDMISETNSKRRRLERERRALERPQPTRRFPLPPAEVPPAPTLREIVKSSPFGIPEAALPLSKRYQHKREPLPSSSLVYPQISSLSPGEIVQDLDLFFQHRRAAAGFDPHRGGPGLMNSVLGGLPPPGMDPYAMGMQILEGPAGGRFAPPFHQQHLQPQGFVQGFGAPPPRLPHHHSAPPGTLPHLSHAQMQIDQEIAMGMRPPPGMPPHPSHMQPQFGAGPGPSTLMRRSISPVPLSNGVGDSSGIPTSMGGGPIPPGFSGSKPNGWTGPSTGVHMGPGKELSRLNGEVEGRERERERDRDRDRDRMSEALSHRERAERERAQRDLERDQAERAYHIAHGQPRLPAHQHTHTHAHNNAPAPAAHGPHHHLHHHHHHHVRHHHPTSQTGPGSVPQGPPMSGLPSGAVNGPAPNPTRSPHGGREIEPRRPRSGAPTELIELTASSQRSHTTASPRMSAFWRGNDDAAPTEMQRERERDRGRAPGPSGPPPPGPHERLPFTMGPSQPLLDSRPGSPRGMLGNPPPSMPSSRRGSWSAAADDGSVGRPPSASHAPSPSGMPPGGSGSGSQRPSSSRMPQPSSTPSFHSPFGSPPYGNPPPGSPQPSSFAGSMRSPTRGSQSGRGLGLGHPGMPMSPPPLMTHSPRLSGSPGMKTLSRARPSSPRLGKGLPKMEGFPMPESGNIAPIGAGIGGGGGPSAGPSSLSGPGALLPPLPSTLSSSGMSRLANGGLSEKPPAHLPGGPSSTKAVPVDGL
ncbi:uncharacterized protein TRAVEDRAFT_74747 [Trametes versicolor FP-101664 SS1]|uniref:uncharacterized protein n=1 Tax=Trametes versicolor (strain FP-101664) TaxID=717944 RepID=UPI0004622190|nr:uncharacterized protein TRAVEDRAFT_74747 [Trametes versicolor FP-101664 SS1]EIW53416.1 hypothetical protein TRAVEDRAFT_74747 [Trametes versicolor FP-101664 SS1]